MTQEGKRTCFIISPIGKEDSDTRKTADDFLELLVEPVLARYDFDVTRADKIARPSTITADIIRLVQESDLCIIDLTNNNPNVFYECGRRHETGRPFIQMVRKGDEENLPFDVAGIRTVIYDLSDPRSVLESQKKLQEWIDAIVADGLEARPSGESLSSLAQAVERLDRKVNKLLASPSFGIPEKTSSKLGFETFLKPPKEAYIEALNAGALEDAYRILERIKKVSDVHEYIAAVGLLVSMGEERALGLLDVLIEEVLADKSKIDRFDDLLTTIAQVLYNYANNTGKFKEIIEILDNLLSKLLPRADITNKTKAFTANKIGMLSWQINDYDHCIRYTKQAKELSPGPSFSYNLCLAYRKKGMKEELEEELDTLSKMDDLDDDHKRLLREEGYNI